VRTARPEIGPGSSRVEVRILDFLERALLSPDEKVHELVRASFLENLDPFDKGYENLKAMLGPNLRRELETYRR
jgi:hypothetical protein